jgi:hypothetical protein
VVHLKTAGTHLWRICHFSETVSTVRPVIMKVSNRNCNLVYLICISLYLDSENFTVITGSTQLFCSEILFKYCQRKFLVSTAALYVM